MKRVFISYSFSRKEDFRRLHKELKNFLKKEFDLEVYAFVFDFTQKVDDKKLMDKALEKIGESDILIVELSKYSVGIGIEAGFAKAKGIPIIYLHNEGTDSKQTMLGIADEVYTYSNTADLIKQIASSKKLQS